MDDARYTRIIHSRLCCNLYVVHGRESNTQPVDHEYDALTTTPPSHINVGAINVVLYWRNNLYQYWCNISNVGRRCIILPIYWRFISAIEMHCIILRYINFLFYSIHSILIAFIRQFAPICAILDQYNANIVCYTG